MRSAVFRRISDRNWWRAVLLLFCWPTTCEHESKSATMLLPLVSDWFPVRTYSNAHKCAHLRRSVAAGRLQRFRLIGFELPELMCACGESFGWIVLSVFFCVGVGCDEYLLMIQCCAPNIESTYFNKSKKSFESTIMISHIHSDMPNSSNVSHNVSSIETDVIGFKPFKPCAQSLIGFEHNSSVGFGKQPSAFFI